MTVTFISCNRAHTELAVPGPMGEPAANQLDGTKSEQLAELAGRVCYDSLGQGRDSEAYHQHIRAVGHLSVYEHCVFTVCIRGMSNPCWYAALFNRPGVTVRLLQPEFDGDRLEATVRVTLNLRAVLEWDRWSRVWHDDLLPACGVVGELMWQHASRLAPQVCKPRETSQLVAALLQQTHLIDPTSYDELWITLYLEGSRSFSHEMVRHGDFSAISQRSTRYCDEHAAAFITHPGIKKLREAATAANTHPDQVDVALAAIHMSRRYSRRAYNAVAHVLQDLGEDKKSARGAAATMLQHDTQTALIFTASARQWINILSQRTHTAANAEIRQVMKKADRMVRAAIGHITQET